ncbi:MAG TPA: CheR family methyltransferase, partial [Acidimicrobiales bacterium]
RAAGDRPVSGPDAEHAAGDPTGDPAYRLAEATVNETAGIRVHGTIRTRVRGSLRELAGARGVTPLALARDLGADAPAVEALVEAATVQESWWFRDPAQMAVVADLEAQWGAVGHLWCAGCAHGQDPYSLAIALDEVGLTRWRVLATDIDQAALARTRTAAYSGRELRGLSPAHRERFFEPDGLQWTVRPMIRRRVAVLHHNLATEPSPLGARWPVIFCRNVLMYFDAEHRSRTAQLLVDALAPGGWLFLGSAESLWRVHDDLELVRMGAGLAHRRRVRPPRAIGGSAPAVAAEPRRATAGRPDAWGDGEGVERELAALRSAGLAAFRGGDLRRAVRDLRRAAYLSASDAVDHFHLGVALERAGHPVAARRAFRGALATSDTTDRDRIDAALDEHREEHPEEPLAVGFDQLLRGKVNGR